MNKARPAIKIAHLHVSDKKNKGDVAIVLAVQEQLRQNFPGCQIIDYPVYLLKNGTRTEAEKINRADLVVIGGGGILYSYFLPYNQEFIKAIKKPIALMSVGYIKEVDAPALNPALVKSIVFLARQAQFVGVRDNNTKNFLVKNGLVPKKIQVIGDSAALLKENKPKKFKVYRDSKIRIGLNLNYSGWLGFGKWREDILRTYYEVAQYFSKKYGKVSGRGVEFYYLKHHPGEKMIYPELKIRGLKVVDLKPGEQKYIYGQLDLIIGMMLHSGVMAFGAGTPEISVAYDLRNYSFAEFIKSPELVVNLSDLKRGELLRRVKLVFKKRKYYQIKFSKVKKEIEKLHKKFLKETYDYCSRAK